MKGLNIVIVGASRGIGFEVARKASSGGHNLFCISRNLNALDRLRNECLEFNSEAGITILGFDISTAKANPSFLPGKVKEVMPRIDILLNNAGLLINKKFSEFSIDEAVKIFDVNLFSTAEVIRQLLPLMGVHRLSHIVNIGSMGGFQGSSKFSGLSYYSASKAALACLSECLAEEMKEMNIRVNCLALGAAQTEMLEEAFPGYKAPLSASEMADYIYHFMCSGHNYFNGKILPVSVSTP